MEKRTVKFDKNCSPYTSGESAKEKGQQQQAQRDAQQQERQKPGRAVDPVQSSEPPGPRNRAMSTR